MVFDPITRRLIMFGGFYGASGAGLNYTWIYDPHTNAWARAPVSLDRPLPPARASTMMVFDPDTGKLIMFGGGVRIRGDTLVAEEQFNDTWAYDPSSNTWTNLSPAGAVPEARYCHVMAYDPSTKKAILFGGITAAGPVNDTWAYDPVANTWTELKPLGMVPPKRGILGMDYDPISRQLIVFGGGVSPTELLGDFWAYDPAANTWKELKPSGPAPSPRGGHTMAYDPTIRRMIVFGGLDDTGTFCNDTWPPVGVILLNGNPGQLFLGVATSRREGGSDRIDAGTEVAVMVSILGHHDRGREDLVPGVPTKQLEAAGVTTHAGDSARTACTTRSRAQRPEGSPVRA
jgi:N-acetylneuraminic acid mutarotase